MPVIRVLAAAVVGLAVVATGNGATARSSGAVPVAKARCSAIQNPDGTLLVVADLPLHGAAEAQALQMSQAIASELEAAGWHAGKYTLAYQSCDDSTAATGHWDGATCQANAAAYAADGAVVGVIGPPNSGCAELELPTLNRAPNGPLAIVNPANTYTGLTHAGPGTAAGEPARYYPSGKRNYVRLLAPDDLQGAADAMLAKQLGTSRLFVLDDREQYGVGIATAVATAAKKLGLGVVGFAPYDPSATSYTSLAARVKASGANAVFLGGLLGSGGGRLIADLRAGAPGATLIAPSGFTPVPAVVSSAGSAAEGLYVSVAGLPVEKLPPAGQKFAKAFAAQAGAEADPSAAYAAQAADVLLRAVAASNGTRSGVAAQLAAVKLPRGIIGKVAFDTNGDLEGAPVSVYRVSHGTAALATVLVPSPSLVATG